MADTLCSPDALPADGDLLSDYEKRYCSPGAQAGLILVRSLADVDLLAAARDMDSASFAGVLSAMGPDTNPYWIVSQAACTAYDRGLIGETELDHLTD